MDGSGRLRHPSPVATGAWAAIPGTMRQNHGLATRGQLREWGLPERTLRRRLAEGLLVRVNSQVVALPGLPLDLRTNTRAVLLVHPRAIPTGPSAAAFLGPGPWDGFEWGIVPWVVHTRTRAVQARVVAHPGVRAVRAGGMAVCRPADALVDLIRFWPREHALDVAQRALVRGTVALPFLVQAQAELTGLGGARQLREVVRDLGEGIRSEAERRATTLLSQAGISGWIANHRVRAGSRWYVLDIAFPAQRLAVEIDGRAFHSDARAFQRDRHRQNDLVGAGWTVLRFTWSDLVDRPEYVVRTIHHAARPA
jgi:very-short-patch-repair endonuclease